MVRDEQKMIPTEFTKILRSNQNLHDIDGAPMELRGGDSHEQLPNIRVVGQDPRILYERPSEVTPNASEIQADFRALGDRLCDQDRQQKRLDLIRNCDNFCANKRTTSV